MTLEEIKSYLNTITDKIPATLRLNKPTYITNVRECLKTTICRVENGSDVDLDLLNEIVEKLKESNLD
jgi:hypothetical protein